MSRIVIELDDRKAMSRLEQLLKSAKDATPAFRAVGRVLVSRIRLCFTMGVSPWGSPWAPLKIRRGQPLLDRGLLRNSITSKADATGVTVGTNQMPRARVHQFGAVIHARPGKRLVFKGADGRKIVARRVSIPARPYLPLRSDTSVDLPPSWSADVVRALLTYFRRADA